MAHEMIKAVLTYEAETVQEILSRKYPRWKIISTKKYRIFITRPELPQRGRGYVYPDVVWIVRSHSGGLEQYIVHEVKVGKYEIREVVRKYEGVEVRWGKYKSFLRLVRGGSTPLFIWAWEREHKRNIITIREDELLSKYMKRGGIRLIPLELILPLVRKRVLETRELLGFDLEKEKRAPTAVGEATNSGTKIEYQGTKSGTNPHKLMGKRVCGECIHYDAEFMYCRKLIRHLVSPGDLKARICPEFKPRGGEEG